MEEQARRMAPGASRACDERRVGREDVEAQHDGASLGGFLNLSAFSPNFGSFFARLAGGAATGLVAAAIWPLIH